MKTTLHLILAALGLATFNLCTSVVQAQDYTYTNNNGAITITKYIGPGGAVIIPDAINGLPVANIGLAAFAHGSLTSVTIPNSVTNIGNEAFFECEGLTNVTIGHGVTSIGNDAFSFCTSLNSVTIPDSVTSIGNDAFYFCNSLTSVTIGNSVTSIGNGAFAHCTILTSVTIPSSVTSIGTAAFAYCSLTSITIGTSVTSIGTAAFSSCTSLSAITVDVLNSVYSSLDGVLFNKRQTTLMQCPGSKAGSYIIPNSVINIRDLAFSYCRLTNLTIPGSVTSIGGLAFYQCTSLTNVTFPDSVTSIGANAFWACINLTEVYFQGNSPSVGTDVFLDNNIATVYYLPGTTGWSSTFADRPTAPWVLPYPVILNLGPSFGIQTNAFNFIISWATNIPVVVEASANLTSPAWSAVSTNTLTDGWSYFSDAEWTNYPSRFYRVRGN